MPICANAAAVTELPPPAKRFALLVGVGKYKDPSITTLNGPAHDIEELKNTLVTFGGFDANNIETLTSDSQDDSQLPRRDNIIWKLNRLKQRLAGGLLLVAFSGHGIYKFKTSYLLTYETIADNAIDLTETAVSVDWLRRKLQTVNAKQIILLLDACQDDPEASKGFGDNTMSPEFKAAFQQMVIQPFQASAILYATSPPYRAYIDNAQRGFFTDAIAEALSGKANRKDGEPPITLGQLMYVEEEVPPA